MINKISILLLFLPFLLVSCSNDEPGNNGEGENYGYVAVNIVQPRSGNVRAASDFEEGSETENFAKEALFFIFDNDGYLITGGKQRRKLNGVGTSTAPNPEVERIYNAVLIIAGETVNPTTSKQIVTVLNAPSGFETGITKLSQLREKIGEYNAHTEGTFIMSNSVYKEGNSEVCATPITDADIKKSESEALAHPVEIYAERVVAKIRVETDPNGFKNTDGANVIIDGESRNFKIKITGIEIANIADKAYMLKNINGIGTNAEWNWVWDANNKRSYWEIVPTSALGMTFSNKSYNDIAVADFDINGLAGDNKFIEYVLPNTPAGDTDPMTSVLVTAELTDASGNGIDTFVYIRGGYTTYEGAMNVVASYLAGQGYYKKTSNNKYRQLEPSDLVWKNGHDDNTITGLKDYEVIAQLADANMKIYNIDGTEISNGAAEVNNKLKSATTYRARVYTGGKCYYFVPIDHSGVAGSTVEAGKYKGVVRNHIYSLTLQSIKGLGAPVFDPKDVIIPDIPKDTEAYYLAARINVLPWRLVTQNINFGGQ